MQEKFPWPNPMQDDEDLFDTMFSVASSNECTGLIPSSPIDEQQVDSYSEIYDTTLAKDPEEAKNNLQDVHKSEKSLF